MRQAVVEIPEPTVNQVRLDVNRSLNPQRKAALGQFMTPASVAEFMASQFSKPRSSAVRLLDAGAGVGSLTDAFLRQWGSQGTTVTAYEIDAALSSHLRHTLDRHRGDGFTSTVIDHDFIQDVVFRIKMGNQGPGFTHAILNPPYKKINNDSIHRALLRKVGLETVNLYTGFLGLALELMVDGGELVAIIPRSFCNGLYYRAFREWMLTRSAIAHIHLFHSRTSAFNDDDVLQENIIIKLVRGKGQGRVTVSTSNDTSFSDLQSHTYPFSEIVRDEDDEQFIHVPLGPDQTSSSDLSEARKSLDEIEVQVSTGPVVDFRLKDFLRTDPAANTVPLLYPVHFSNGAMKWPRESKKPNALVNNTETRKWLYPAGFYTIVRRFSSKEERRRIVAHVVDPAVLNSSDIAFENHLNVFHSNKAGLDPDIARGIAVFLNSTAVDDTFRRFSGHTQVNATDLRRLKYPTRAQLRHLGQWMEKQETPSQEEIDEQVEVLRGC